MDTSFGEPRVHMCLYNPARATAAFIMYERLVIVTNQGHFCMAVLSIELKVNKTQAGGRQLLPVELQRKEGHKTQRYAY